MFIGNVRGGPGRAGRTEVIAVDVRSVARVSFAASACLLFVLAVVALVFVGVEVLVGVGPRIGKFLKDANGGNAINFVGSTARVVYGATAAAILVLGTVLPCVAAAVGNGVARWVGGIELRNAGTTLDRIAGALAADESPAGQRRA